MLRSAALIMLLASPVLAQEKELFFEGVDSIDARNGVTVNVIPGEEVTVTATAISGDVDQLDIRKFGPWLAINRNTRWFIFPYGRQDEIEVTITLPELRNIKAFDTATATASGFSGDSLRIEALQGGTVSVEAIAVAEVTLNATEGGVLTVSGTCETNVAEAQFSAAIAATQLICDNVAATTRADATLAAHATTLASQNSENGGSITIEGNPEIVDFLPGMEPEDQDTDS